MLTLFIMKSYDVIYRKLGRTLGAQITRILFEEQKSATPLRLVLLCTCLSALTAYIEIKMHKNCYDNHIVFMHDAT